MKRESKMSETRNRKIGREYRRSIRDMEQADVLTVLDNVPKKIRALVGKDSPDWIKDLIRQVKLLWEMVRDWWVGSYEAPWMTIAAGVAALLYFINPIDAIPDFIPIAGYLDDAGVIAICLSLIQSDLRKYALVKGRKLPEYGI